MSQKTFHLAPLHAYTCLCFYVRPNTCDKVLASLILRPVRFGCVITLPHTPLPFLSSIMLMPAILVTGALLFTLAGLALQRNYRKAKGYPFPPGPCRVPIIGNLFDMPRRMAWLSFSAMSQEYGEYSIYIYLYPHRSISWSFGRWPHVLQSIKSGHCCYFFPANNQRFV